MTEKRYYPTKEEAISCITDDVAKQLGFEKAEDLYERYNGYGSFCLERFINFNDNFFKESYDSLEFAENYDNDSYGRVSGGHALLSAETIIIKGGSKGSSKYERKFDTGHILAHMLIGKMDGFNSSKNNTNNIFPQTTWSNGGDRNYESAKINSNRGNSQFTYESRILNKIKKNKQQYDEFRIYYQVRLIYHGEEGVPRGIHIQATSNDISQELNKNNKNLNVFIPNVRYGEEGVELEYSSWEKNSLDPKYR
ncbi:DNA/RNA non-specific endonuclease [Streptococcus suis]|nr:DNA/RNA non-specific endonuclease [Streptococcus suis]